jgi:hypothetical protein
MKRSLLPGLCVIATLIAAPGFVPRATAAPKICPQFLTAYCVVTPSGHRETIETNPCFARQKHLRILHRGACKR